MSKKISITALFSAFAVILSYLESFIPQPGIPGVKLGLANLAVVIALYVVGGHFALIINIVRIIIVGAFFGSLFSILFSIAGALLSFLVMFILKSTNKVSIVTVGICGGTAHNLAQIIIAAFVVDTYSIFYYFPMLLITGIITGCFVGITANLFLKRFVQFKN